MLTTRLNLRSQFLAGFYKLLNQVVHPLSTISFDIQEGIPSFGVERTRKKGGVYMSTTGEKPGRGTYTCTKCNTIITLDDHTDTLPPCPKCHNTDFRP
ncbi:zinc ribbon-containing protein [Paenibacillus lactis]|uniref:zinc ribbon-containing protein n=1 Tax=Paenibacillus lactis TaxID=228574 RepID=UPI003D813509